MIYHVLRGNEYDVTRRHPLISEGLRFHVLHGMNYDELSMLRQWEKVDELLKYQKSSIDDEGLYYDVTIVPGVELVVFTLSYESRSL